MSVRGDIPAQRPHQTARPLLSVLALVYLALLAAPAAAEPPTPIPAEAALTPPTAEALAERLGLARDAAASGELTRAQQLYDELLRARPNDSALWVEAGRMLSDRGMFGAALPYWEEAARVDALSIDPLVGLGVTLDGLGRNAEAIRIYRRALLLSPGHADALFNLGRLEFVTRDLDRAELTYRELVTRYPEHWKGYNNLGLVLLDRGQPTAAMAPLRTALRLKPDDPGVIYNLGRAWAARRDYARAIALFDRALALWGETDMAAVPVHFARGNALFALGRYEDAATSFRRALSLDPQFGGAHLNLGASLANLGRWDDAVAELEHAVEDGATEAVVFRQIAACHIEARDFKAALTALREAQRLNDRDAETWVMLGRVYDALEQPVQARDARDHACRFGHSPSCAR